MPKVAKLRCGLQTLNIKAVTIAESTKKRGLRGLCKLDSPGAMTAMSKESEFLYALCKSTYSAATACFRAVQQREREEELTLLSGVWRNEAGCSGKGQELEM